MCINIPGGKEGGGGGEEGGRGAPITGACGEGVSQGPLKSQEVSSVEKLGVGCVCKRETGRRSETETGGGRGGTGASPHFPRILSSLGASYPECCDLIPCVSMAASVVLLLGGREREREGVRNAIDVVARGGVVFWLLLPEKDERGVAAC